MSERKSPRNRRTMLPEMNTDGVAAFLRRRHPVNTAHMVEGQTGIPHRTVENWLHRNNEMRAVHLLLLVSVYGPDVLAAAWPVGANGGVPSWLDAGRAADELAALEAEARRNETRRLELQAQLTAGGGR